MYFYKIPKNYSNIKNIYRFTPIKRRYIYLINLLVLNNLLNLKIDEEFEELVYCIESINIANYLFELTNNNSINNFGILNFWINKKLNLKKKILLGDYFFTLASDKLNYFNNINFIRNFSKINENISHQIAYKGELLSLNYDQFKLEEKNKLLDLNFSLNFSLLTKLLFKKADINCIDHDSLINICRKIELFNINYYKVHSNDLSSLVDLENKFLNRY